MNKQAVIHHSRSFMSFPLDCEHFVIRLQTAAHDFDAVALIYSENKHAFDQLKRRVPMERRFSGSELDDYEITLTLGDTRLAYYFELQGQGKAYYFTEEGLSETLDPLLSYFYFFQYPFIHEADVHRVIPWTVGASVYQIFPDRFARGDVQKDASYINAPWDEKPTPKSLMGGDLKGILERLPYLKDLGIACLYTTPVFASPSNHKYDTVDYTRVDPMFGGDEALTALVKAAHEKGIKVVLDGVFNHSSELWPIFLEAKAEKHSAYRDWFFFKPNNGYETFAAVPYMPKLNTGNSAVIDYFCGIARYWMRKTGIDGWRIDVADEISPTFLRAFCKAVKEENKDAVVWGEFWHEAQYYLQGEIFDGVMNYPLTKACLDFFAFEAIGVKAFAERLIRLTMSNTGPANRMMLNLLDCHDTERFLLRTKGDKDKLRAAFAVLTMMEGMPMVYYGDEIGMTGGYDPDCRRAFPWKRQAWDEPLRAFYKEWIELKKTPVMTAGKLSIKAREDCAVLTRELGEKQVTLIVSPNGIKAVKKRL